NPDDVGMAELLQERRFALEAFQRDGVGGELRMQHLDRDHGVGEQVAGQVHAGERPFPDAVVEPVAILKGASDHGASDSLGRVYRDRTESYRSYYRTKEGARSAPAACRGGGRRSG